MAIAFVPPFSFRAAADEVELERLFRLRQRVFSASEDLWELVAGTSVGIDVQGHDLCAVHYGVFDADGRAMAAVRAVDREAKPHAAMVLRVAQAHGLAVSPAVENPFSMLAQCDRTVLLPLLENQWALGLRVVECGRLCVDPAAGARRAHIFRFIAECTLAAEFFGRRVDVMYGLSTVPLFRYYRQLGFERVPGVPEIEAFSTRVRGILFVVRREKLQRQRTANLLAQYAKELNARGRINAPFDEMLHATC